HRDLQFCPSFILTLPWSAREASVSCHALPARCLLLLRRSAQLSSGTVSFHGAKFSGGAVFLLSRRVLRRRQVLRRQPGHLRNCGVLRRRGHPPAPPGVARAAALRLARLRPTASRGHAA